MPTYRLVGFDKYTERLVSSEDVPKSLLRSAKNIAGVRVRCFGAIPLSAENAVRLADVLAAKVDTHKVDYFFEPFSD